MVEAGEIGTISSDSQVNEDLEHGFHRAEMNQNQLAGTVELYDQHIFLCYKNFQDWPTRVENSEWDPLPRLLFATLKARKNDIGGKVRLTVCEAKDDSGFSDGDVLIFPDRIKYRGLTDLNVESFVDDVIVKKEEWAPNPPEPYLATHVFVCCHGSRDQRCGFCGPVLVDRFKKEIKLRDQECKTFVTPCSHIGGHKYAGNVIIFSLNWERKITTGYWFGYVTPDDVPILLDEHIGKGGIIHRLWRGQMGLSPEEQKKMVEEIFPKCEENGINSDKQDKEQTQYFDTKDAGGCCQGVDGFSCCRDGKIDTKDEINDFTASKKQGCGIGLCALPSWLKKWDQEHTIAAAVIGVISLTVAYSIYRKSR